MGYKSKEVINTLAKTAADSYLKNKTPLNTSLKKIASAEGLEPHQVGLVAAEANKLVWASNYQSDKKAAYDFPLADPHVVVSDLQIKPTEKIAMVNMDYTTPPSSLQKQASDKQVYGEFKTDLTDDNDKKVLKFTLQSRYEKLAQARDVAAGDLTIMECEIDALEKKFVKEAREMIIHTPFTERATTMEKIAEFINSTGKYDTGRRLMTKLSQKIVKDGLVKQADMKAPEQYISEKLPARIINGNHSLFITIDTLVKQENRYSNLKRDFIICDDTLPVLKEKIRGL